MANAVALSPISVEFTASITPALSEYGLDYWPAYTSVIAYGGGSAVDFNLAPTVQLDLAGWMAASYYSDWYENIHLIPGVLVLGNVLSVQQRDIEVWNGYYHDMELQEIQELGTDGMQLDSDMPPFTFAALESRIWQVQVEETGPSTINALYTLLWQDDSVVVLQITGSRVVVWSHRHNWREDVTDAFSWLTDLQRSRNGSEEAVALRALPRRTMSQLTTVQNIEAAAMDAKLWGWGGRPFAVPVWWDRTYSSAAVEAGDTTVPVLDTSDREFEVGGVVILLRRWNDFEVAEVLEFTGSSIELARPLENGWPAGVEVYPARIQRLPAEVEHGRITATVGEMPLRWESADRLDLVPDDEAVEYRGLPVMTRRPDRADVMPITYRRELSRIDNNTGRLVVEDRPGRPSAGPALSFVLKTRAEIVAFMRFMYRLQGRRGAFWVPTWTHDLQVTQTIGAADTAIIIRSIDFARFYGVTTSRRDLQFLIAGQPAPLYRRIISAEDIGGGQEQLGIDTALGINVVPSAITMLSFMAPSKLLSDTVELQRRTAGVALVTIGTRSLDHDE